MTPTGAWPTIVVTAFAS